MENKKTFTQKDVDEIIKERLERERKSQESIVKQMQDYSNQVESLQKEFSTLKDNYQQLQCKYKNEKIKNDVIKTLQDNNVFNPEAVSELFINKATLDDNSNESTIEGEPLKNYVEKWASENLWAVKDTQKAGSGRGVSHSISNTYNKPTLEEAIRDIMLKR